MHHQAHCHTLYRTSDQGAIIPLLLLILLFLRMNKGKQSPCTVFQQIMNCAIFTEKKNVTTTSHLWMQAQFRKERRAFQPAHPLSAAAAVVLCWRAVLKLTACSADKGSSQWKERSSSSSSSPLSESAAAARQSDAVTQRDI